MFLFKAIYKLLLVMLQPWPRSEMQHFGRLICFLWTSVFVFRKSPEKTGNAGGLFCVGQTCSWWNPIGRRERWNLRWKTEHRSENCKLKLSQVQWGSDYSYILSSSSTGTRTNKGIRVCLLIVVLLCYLSLTGEN